MSSPADLFSLQGRTALVTGGSRGLGLEIAEGLGQAGARVAITARRREWLDEAERTLRGNGIDCLVLAGDVSDSRDVVRIADEATRAFGRIDILVNAAGRSWGAPAEEMPLQKWHEVMDANATGTFLMCQAVGRGMIGRRFGRIINVASLAGLSGQPPEVLDAVGYSASKGAIIALTKDLAVKWARHGITVNAIAPGWFPTRMSEKVIERAGQHLTAMIPMGRIGRPGEVKGAAVFLASEAASYITGQVFAIDGGLLAL
ncbi:MAG TPA: SDR family oxidoreductase [bacterium]|nr:SDR family oxidoreductase [bacterium]